MRRKIAAGNWKMNLTEMEARSLVTALSDLKIPKNVLSVIASPSPYLSTMKVLAGNNNQLHISAQDVHQADKGAYTGDVSHAMLQSIGINWTLIGHSERREYHKESNSLLKAKLNTAIANDLNVIFCCGEPLAIRKKRTQASYVLKQLKQSVFHLEEKHLNQLVIAYEPIWAIGTGLTASPKQAQEMHATIRKAFAKVYGKKNADQLSILYGGSVKSNNARSIFKQKDVDGGLVGGASLNYESFKAIIHSF